MATYATTGSIGSISALGYDLPLRVWYQFLWGPTLLNYFFTLLIYSVVYEGILAGFLKLPWLRYLGKISYGVYVYHFPVMWFVARFFEEHIEKGKMAFLLNVLVSFSITILIATLSYYFLEKPILNLKDRFFAWSPTPATG